MVNVIDDVLLIWPVGGLQMLSNKDFPFSMLAV